VHSGAGLDAQNSSMYALQASASLLQRPCSFSLHDSLFFASLAEGVASVAPRAAPPRVSNERRREMLSAARRETASKALITVSNQSSGIRRRLGHEARCVASREAFRSAFIAAFRNGNTGGMLWIRAHGGQNLLACRGISAATLPSFPLATLSLPGFRDSSVGTAHCNRSQPQGQQGFATRGLFKRALNRGIWHSCTHDLLPPD
jgi:hypothetical protein